MMRFSFFAFVPEGDAQDPLAGGIEAWYDPGAMQRFEQLDPRRQRRYAILVGIILITLPCYCAGWIAIRRAPEVSLLPTETATSEPIVQTLTPSPTVTITATITLTPTMTPTGFVPSPSPTTTITPTPTETPIPSDTPLPTDTPTNTPTQTATHTITPTATATLEPTLPLPTATFTATNSSTP